MAKAVNNKAVEKGSKKITVRSLCIVLAIVSFLLYANTLQNGYAMDDVMVCKDNTIVAKGIQGIPELLATPHLYGYINIPGDTYRPLSLVFFAIQYQLSGFDPAVGHLVNIAVYIGCVLLLFLFLNRLFGGNSRPVAFIAALLFAIHPVHTEVVANIKSLDEELSYFFGLLSLLLFMRYMKDGRAGMLVLGSASFFLALLSKESVITFLLLMPLVFFFYDNANKKRAAFISASAILAAAVFLSIRAAVLAKYPIAGAPVTSDFTVNALAGASFADRIATEWLVLGKYLALLVFPYPLLCNYSYNSIPLARFGNVWVLLSVLVYISMAVTAVLRLAKHKNDSWTLGISFFLVPIALYANFFFFTGAEMADRFLFFPSTGFCIIIALVIDRLLIRNKAVSSSGLKNGKVLALLGALLLVLGGATIARNADWRDNYTLYKADQRRSPDDCRLNYYLGSTLTHHADGSGTEPGNDRINEQQGMSYLYKAIAIYPAFSEAHAELARVYDGYGMYDSAITHNLAALSANPDNSIANYNLAREYFIQKQYPVAIPYFRKAIVLNSAFELACLNLALCYQAYNQYDSAIVYFHRTLALNRQQTYAIKGLAAAFTSLGKADSAAVYNAMLRGSLL